MGILRILRVSAVKKFEGDCMRLFKVLFVLLPCVCGWLLPAVAADSGREIASYQKDLQHGLEYKRMLAIEALARQRTPEANGLILKAMLYDKSKAVRRTAQRKLEYVQDTRILPAIAAALKSPERRVRLAAIDALAKVRDASAATYLIAGAQAEPNDSELVLTAMESLREMVYWVEPPEGFEFQLHPYLQHKDYRVRWTVLGVLGVMGRPSSVKPLMEMWPSSDTKARIRIADAFANIGRVEPAELLTAALEQNSDDLKIHCLYALAQIQSFSAAPRIRSLMLKNAGDRVRMACLYALLEIPEAENVPAILRVMQDGSPTVLHWAGYALAQLHAREAIPELGKMLGHGSPLVRATAATALGELGEPIVQGKLLERVQDPKEATEVKIAAAKGLMRLGYRGSAEVFWKELQNPKLEWETRLTLSLALGASRDPAYAGRLAAWLHDSDFEKALSAGLALGSMGDEAAKPLLLKALEHGYPSVRRYAILGLEGILSQEVLAALANTANDDHDPLVRVLCASALSAAGLTDFRVLLWNSLDNSQEDLRSEAAVALGRSADDVTLRQLKWYLRREPSVPVRQTIQKILRERK